MKKIETEITIKATPERVWEILTDFDRYPEWNTFVKSVDGHPRVGEHFSVRIHPPGGNTMTFRPRLLVFDAPREFRWRGNLLLNGLFDGEHYFLLRPLDGQATHLTHGEIFTGLLVSTMDSVLEKTRSGFESMNLALKAECEVPVG